MGKRWVQKVKTVSTFPPAGTFNRPAEEVAQIMAQKKVSPKGLGSGIRMIQFFMNRAGKGLSPARRRELERAKDILHSQLAEESAARSRKKRWRRWI